MSGTAVSGLLDVLQVLSDFTLAVTGEEAMKKGVALKVLCQGDVVHGLVVPEVQERRSVDAQERAANLEADDAAELVGTLPQLCTKSGALVWVPAWPVW